MFVIKDLRSDIILLKLMCGYSNENLKLASEELYILDYDNVKYVKKWVNYVNEQIIVKDEVIQVLKEENELLTTKKQKDDSSDDLI